MHLMMLWTWCRARKVENFLKKLVNIQFYGIGPDLEHSKVRIWSGFALKSCPFLVLFEKCNTESGVINSISCLDDSISCCAFQNYKDLLTMVSSGGKLKTDSFARVLMRVYYQIEIPYPVSHIKSGKTGFEWIWGVLSRNFISCCAIQQRKTKQEMKLIIWL